MTADLYIIDLGKDTRCAEERNILLAGDERKRADSFIHPIAKKKYCLSRIYLRLLLSLHLDEAPEDIEFHHNKFGKPFLKRGSHQFNLSHSEDYLVIAITQQDLIGIDIEYCQRKRNHVDLAKRFFTSHEANAIFSSSDSTTLFFHIWTQKEAFLKAIGQGLSFGCDRFEVSTNLSASYVKNIADPIYNNTTWDSRSFDTIPNYRITLTKKNSIGQVRLHNL